MEPKRGGVILRLDGALYFVPASVALAITSVPEIARVPGAPEALLGAALHDGDVVPVVSIGKPGVDRAMLGDGSMLVCSYLGEKVGLLGASIVATGLYEVDPAAADSVRHEGETARTLDLSAIYARVQGEGWAGRWRA
ncbi:MAG: chemotaxis protein CheW [Polyangiaceae bacterium]